MRRRRCTGGRNGGASGHAVALALALAAALALGLAAPAARAQDPAFLSLGAGWFDVRDDEDAADFRLEYRHDGRLLFLKPWAGLEATSDGALWGGGGLLIDVFFGRRLVLTGSLGAGGYAEGGGKDLGSALEFRSQVELGVRFDDRSRLAVAFGHISNAGITEKNPGTEIVTVYYHLPLTRLLGE